MAVSYRICQLWYILNQLQRKGQRWIWLAACKKAFESSKKVLIENSVLVRYDSNKLLQLDCDAMLFGVGEGTITNWWEWLWKASGFCIKNFKCSWVTLCANRARSSSFNIWGMKVLSIPLWSCIYIIHRSQTIDIHIGSKIWYTYPCHDTHAEMGLDFIFLPVQNISSQIWRQCQCWCYVCHDYHQALMIATVKVRMTFFKPLTLTNYQLEQKTYNKRLSMTVCYQKFYNIPYRDGQTVQSTYQKPLSHTTTEKIS